MKDGQHVCILSTDIRVTIPKSIRTKMDLHKDDFVVIIEKPHSFEVFKAKVDPITTDGDIIE